MSRPSRWRRRLARVGLWGLVGLLVLALVGGLLGIWAVRRPFPTYDGDLPLAGLTAPVTVHRDGYGVPQVYAETVEDLFRAQGYLHAQDRFWEMDLRRHVTSGRTAELFGESQVETDAFLRTLGWRRVAEAEWDLVSAETQTYLTAYADGVNAWIEATGGPAATATKALQYRILGLRTSGYEVAPWHPIDSLAWLKAMAWDLRSNLVAETDRALLHAAGLSRVQIEELYPEYPYDRHDPIVTEGLVRDGAFTLDGDAPDGDDGGTAGEVGTAVAEVPADVIAGVAERLARVPGLLGTAGAGLGSNSWVVAGDLTDSGAPILVNDPHLGVSLPGIWYQVGLHCTCGFRVSGFSFSGVPGVIIGHNGQIAWGFTNLGHDVTDLHLQRLDGDRYEVDGQWRDLAVREETIRVAGGEDVTIRVRSTHHGPLLSDASETYQDLAGSSTHGVSLAWTALQPGTTIEALFDLNRAGDWDEFRAAAERFEVPAQNLIYADVDGNIGYQAPGRVPVRGDGDGRWPAPGWDAAYDWQDVVPFEELPYVQNPDHGRIVTANQAVIGPQYQPRLTDDWAYGYRSDRIHTLLEEAIASGPLTVPDMEAMLFDNHNPFAPVLVPALLAVPSAELGIGASGARILLAGWDFQQPAEAERDGPQERSAAAAAYFNVTWRHLLEQLFDELPDNSRPNGRDRWFEVVGGLLAEPESHWWDHQDTPEVETRDDILVRALTAAYEELVELQNRNPIRWRWGELHTLRLRDGTFGESGIGPIEALFNRGPFPTGGGGDVVNATSWDAASGYEVVASPSMRMVVDMSDLDGARWVQTTGNSGHAFHRHYTDQVEPWLAGELLPWRWNRATIESEAAHTLRFTPSAA